MEVEKLNEKQITKDIRANLEMILVENTWLLKQMDLNEVANLLHHIKSANQIFITAAGRSGFAMRSAAMRLMHLGFKVFFVGETTTPAIKKGDLLIAASGSGTTSTIVRAAEKAKQVEARIVAISTQEYSSLSSLADLLILIPAADKMNLQSSRSRQYAGSLFEQFLLLLTDAIFQTLWEMGGISADELFKMHANLE